MPKKRSLLEEVPGAGRQVTQFLGNFPVVHHGTQFIHRPVNKGLFLGAQCRGRESRACVASPVVH